MAITTAAILGFLGVAIGAFGAHGLEETLRANGHLETFETGTWYHLIHTLLLLAFGILHPYQGTAPWLRMGIISALVGILIFSGSLYILSVTKLEVLGAITPIGGLAFLLAWFSLFMYARNSLTTK